MKIKIKIFTTIFSAILFVSALFLFVEGCQRLKFGFDILAHRIISSGPPSLYFSLGIGLIIGSITLFVLGSFFFTKK